LSTVTVSAAVFPKGKQNIPNTHSLSSATSILKNLQTHLQTLRKKCQKKMTRSTQHHVTWQTSSEYCRLAVPSGRTLNYVSFKQKIRIAEIFGSPLVCFYNLHLVPKLRMCEPIPPLPNIPSWHCVE